MVENTSNLIELKDIDIFQYSNTNIIKGNSSDTGECLTRIIDNIFISYPIIPDMMEWVLAEKLMTNNEQIVQYTATTYGVQQFIQDTAKVIKQRMLKLAEREKQNYGKIPKVLVVNNYETFKALMTYNQRLVWNSLLGLILNNKAFNIHLIATCTNVNSELIKEQTFLLTTDYSIEKMAFFISKDNKYFIDKNC